MGERALIEAVLDFLYGIAHVFLVTLAVAILALVLHEVELLVAGLATAVGVFLVGSVFLVDYGLVLSYIVVGVGLASLFYGLYATFSPERARRLEERRRRPRLPPPPPRKPKGRIARSVDRSAETMVAAVIGLFGLLGKLLRLIVARLVAPVLVRLYRQLKRLGHWLLGLLQSEPVVRRWVRFRRWTLGLPPLEPPASPPAPVLDADPGALGRVVNTHGQFPQDSGFVGRLARHSPEQK